MFDTLPENNYTTKKSNEEDDSMSTIDSDRIALLKLLNKRKRLKNNNSNGSINLKSIKLEPYLHELSDAKCDNLTNSIDLTEKSNFPSFEEPHHNMWNTVLDHKGKTSAEDESAIRQTLKNVWKNATTSNGGYDIKLHYINVPSSSLVHPIVLDISNNSGQQHIYIKARTFVEVLKGFAYQIQKNFSDIASQINFPYFMDILQSGQFVELRDTPYGENKCSATKKDDREYKDFVMLFLIPSSRGDQQEVLQRFKKFLHQVFSSSHFFYLNGILHTNTSI
jgi:hypothetical protein